MFPTTAQAPYAGFASSSHPSRRRAFLRPDEERALVLAAKHRRGEARTQLVDAFGPLVASYARRYRNKPGVERDELMQQGVVGLLRALERFDTERGTPFWAYAAWWVREAMQELISELTRPVVLSDRAERELARVNDARRTHLRERGRDASLSDIAVTTGLGFQQVANLVAAGHPSRSLDEPARAHGFDACFGDQLADPSAEEAFDTEQWPIDVTMLRPLLQVLSARERRVVMARFGVDVPGRTLRELGAELGISAERVRQIEERALDRLYQAVTRGIGRPQPEPDAPGPGPNPASAHTISRRPAYGVEHRRCPTMTMFEPFPSWLWDVNRLSGADDVAAFIPPADVLVSDEGVSVYMDVPGVGSDRLEIELENEVLTIRGERPYPCPTGDAKRLVHRVERGFGRFERSLRVPPGLDADAIDASIRGGVLTIRILLTATEQPHRIEIREGTDVLEASHSPELATAG